MKARSTNQTGSKRATSPRHGAPASRQRGREVPFEEWRDFLDDFSASHEGWVSDLEVFQPDQTTRIQARGLALEGVSIDADPPDATIAIALGDEATDHITHTIARATRLTAASDDELEIEAEDSGRAVIRCQKAER